MWFIVVRRCFVVGSISRERCARDAIGGRDREKRSTLDYCNDVAFYGIYSPETHSMNIDNRPPHTATLTVLYTAGCGSLVI
jgi:hypothetical protein